MAEVKWTPLCVEEPPYFESVLAVMTDAGPFPAVRECYRIYGDEFYFPALNELHPISHWAYMPAAPAAEVRTCQE